MPRHSQVAEHERCWTRNELLQLQIWENSQHSLVAGENGYFGLHQVGYCKWQAVGETGVPESLLAHRWQTLIKHHAILQERLIVSTMFSQVITDFASQFVNSLCLQLECYTKKKTITIFGNFYASAPIRVQNSFQISLMFSFLRSQFLFLLPTNFQNFVDFVLERGKSMPAFAFFLFLFLFFLLHAHQFSKWYIIRVRPAKLKMSQSIKHFSDSKSSQRGCKIVIWGMGGVWANILIGILMIN